MKGFENLYVKEDILPCLYGNKREEIQIIIPIYNEIYTQIKTALLCDFGEIDYLLFISKLLAWRKVSIFFLLQKNLCIFALKVVLCIYAKSKAR